MTVVVGIYVDTTDCAASSKNAHQRYTQEVPVPTTKFHLEALADDTGAIRNEPVAAVTVGVIAFILYHQFGSDSIVPVYPDDVQTTQLSKSKLQYPDDMPSDASSCI